MKKFGVAAFGESSQYDLASNKLGSQNNELNEQLSIFQVKLVEFARQHNKELRDVPRFRAKFMRMCSAIGIDPLSIFDKNSHLFHIDDFYYQICVKIIEICRNTKDVNGGVISLEELHVNYFKNMNIEMEDIEKAIIMLGPLDGGFELFTIRQKKFLRSVPNELTDDQTKILEICSIMGYASITLLRANLNWKRVRSQSVLDGMVASGLIWVDSQSLEGEVLYWDPSWIINLS
ncbi:Snf8 [Kluyveromyces lactis]|nr:Snf8 [Kluyveromyces lactis]